MTTAIDLTDKKFDRLLVLKRAENDKHRNIKWHCVCDCGKKTIVYGTNLRKGKSRSCGCLITERQTTHGMYETPTHNSWSSMIQRCNNPNFHNWKDYGGRGISIEDPRWLKFEHFFADMGIRPKGKTLDRIKNGKGYCKRNCRWADNKTQARNNRAAKLNKKDIQKIRELREEGKTHQKIADIIGCSRPNISIILEGKTWN